MTSTRHSMDGVERAVEYNSLNVTSKAYYASSFVQKIAGAMAVVCAVVAIIMVSYWMKKTNETEAYMGGLNLGDLIFNWHPILMVTGLIFCFTSSMLSYRLMPMAKMYTKTMHVVLHTVAILCIIFGLSAVIIGNNYTNKNTEGVYYPNLASLHSLLGITAITLFTSNYIIGFTSFLLPVFSEQLKKVILPNHVFLGTFAFFAAVFAAETGIMELTTELGCGYSVSSADWDPAANYHRLADGCKLANGLGVMILLTAFLCAYALFGPGNDTKTGVQKPLIDNMSRSSNVAFDS